MSFDTPIAFKQWTLTPFLLLDDTQLLEVLHIRNHPMVRAMMYTQHSISEAEHFAFVESLKTRSDRLHFALMQGSDILAVFNLYDISHEHHRAMFGMFANPEAKLPGLGFVIDEAALHVSFDLLGLQTLRLEVFADNTGVIALHKRMGFEIEGTLKHYICDAQGMWHDVVVMRKFQ
jgi:UDP-4-amino-4,6-dideoxy-N-acetyl-beta-L-altrosamine N-acetyltransferase